MPDCQVDLGTVLMYECTTKPPLFQTIQRNQLSAFTFACDMSGLAVLVLHLALNLSATRH